jgi:hypothetical protein
MDREAQFECHHPVLFYGLCLLLAAAAVGTVYLVAVGVGRWPA